MHPDPSGDAPLAGAEWLVRRETQAVFAAVAAAGHTARVVGGAVRNALLGRAVSDIDMATTAPPAAVIAAAAAAGIAAHPSGIAHGTVTLSLDHRAYEVTTLRRDVETHGRRATVAFTDDWVADARRRDFTINALYCDAGGRLFDPLGGYGDIVARRVRFIGSAAERIAEDYLRILRFFRFTAEYAAGPPDAAGLAACVAGRDGLALLSAERVRQELLHLLRAARGPELVGWMADYGLILHVLPAVPRPGLLGRLAILEGATGRAGDAMLRLAALAVEVEEDAVRLATRLRLSGAEREWLLRAADRARSIGPETPESAARVRLYKEGAEAYRQRLLLAWVRSGALPASPAWRHRLALPQRWQPPRLPLGGADIVALGVAPGPRVGALLRALEEWWIAGDFRAGEDALRARLAALVAGGAPGAQR